MDVDLDVDYLVVGAGAMGMAFVDALTASADVSVAIVDRRHGAGGHWLDAYGFVRLHQASASLNPARIPADRVDDPAVRAAVSRLQESVGAGRARLAEFAGMT